VRFLFECFVFKHRAGVRATIPAVQVRGEWRRRRRRRRVY